MKRSGLSTVLFAMTLLSAHPAVADGPVEQRDDARPRDEDKATIAVLGDWPYSQNLLDSAPLLINSVNADPDVGLAIHVGDIHSGGMPCTSSNILPPIPTSNPGWNQEIFSRFQQFKTPLVYTPGDNEWADCHKSKELKSGDPLKELASIRSLFFARPGKTLGLEEKDVWTQTKNFDPTFPADAQFVENVIWENAKTVFVTLNMPGSNNDTRPWTNGFENSAAQQQEVAARTDADIRWLQAAFKLAAARQAKAVVIALQADMWDPAALVPGGDGLNAYTPFVRQLAYLSLQFGRPVLLLNGDSHIFQADRPLADPSSATGLIHGAPAAPNLTRITVQGSTSKPAEWLRLTIDTHAPNVFSWQNIPYCADPLSACH